MPAKNASKYLKEAIKGVKKQSRDCWELIIIDDNSTDSTFETALKASKKDSRINVYKNKGNGKVDGLNYGYKISEGNLIKCIDSDDVLHKKYLENCLSSNFKVMCHDCYVTNSDLKIISKRSIGTNFVKSDFKEIVRNFKSLARWTWTFNKELGDLIFPIPEMLPYEDLWFSLIIGRNAQEIRHIEKPLYYYRQHSGQTYGGIYNFDKDVVVFRAKRNLKYIDVLKKKSARFDFNRQEMHDLLRHMHDYYQLMAKEKINYSDIANSKLEKSAKLKLFLIKQFPNSASFLKYASDRGLNLVKKVI